mmetsp:Transcript_22467/g.64585  ORF Transcript_22467/g.64585 Transcript_22467/m.64585 type:complete len:265 (-) Transcript_22467:203-997(-)
MLLINAVAAAIRATPGPLVVPNAIDDGLLPPASEAPPVAGRVHADSIDHIVVPSTRVFRAIHPAVATEPLFVTPLEGPLVTGTLTPSLDAEAMLEVVQPLPHIGGASFVVVDAATVGHVVLPLADEHVPVGMGEPAVAKGCIRIPFAFVRGAIWPYLTADAGPHVAAPLPDIRGAGSEGVHRARGDLGPPPQLGQLLQLAVEVARRPIVVVADEHGRGRRRVGRWRGGEHCVLTRPCWRRYRWNQCILVLTVLPCGRNVLARPR